MPAADRTVTTPGAGTSHRALVVLAVTVMVAGSVLGLAGRAAALSSWRPATTPTHGRPSGAVLAVSCTSATSCRAVGRSVDKRAAFHPLIQTWDGSRWTDVDAAVPAGAVSSQLTGVSCVAGGGCTAVGSYVSDRGVTKPFAESADGKGWAIEVATLPKGATGGALSAVSCVGGTCMATGSYDDRAGDVDPMAEISSGDGFAVTGTVPVPSKAVTSQLGAVSCPAVTACVAVGSSARKVGTSPMSGAALPLVESWDGTGWTMAHTPTPTGGTDPDDALTGVSCPSTGSCLAVGYRTDKVGRDLPLAEEYDGTRWAMRAPARPSGAVASALDAVTCSSSACRAVGWSEDKAGGTDTVAESWDGTSWALETTPVFGVLASVLDGVSCPGGGPCFAGGYQATATSGSTTLDETSGSSTWTRQASPDPVGDPLNALSAVSCRSQTVCTAVGQGRTASGRTLPLVEARDGASWSVQATPVPAKTTAGGLAGVSCTADTACQAVGDVVVRATTPSTEPFAEGWDGSSWTAEDVPMPAGALGGALASVSCPAAGACVAVGYHDDSSGVVEALADVLAAGTWTQTPTPKADGAAVDLSGVSCTAADACTAVGYERTSDGVTVPVAESWDGTAWSLEPQPPVPSKSVAASFAGVDCVTARACTAVGGYETYTDAAKPQIETLPLAESWNGTSWRAHTVEVPTGAADATLSAVSCSGSTCTAVGDDTDATGTDQPVVETSTGSSFGLEPIGLPPRTLGGALGGVSCSAAATCTAVGSRTATVPTSAQVLIETE